MLVCAAALPTADAPVVYPSVPVVALFIAETPDIAASVRACRAFYHLTAAEEQFAVTFLGLLNLNDVAVHLHISRNTARTHLHTLFSKTGTHRQADLVRVLLLCTVRLV
jgi:DNA-binding CsgD family transcriptional regulator